MNMTEKLTRQRVNALMINQWMKNQLKRLKKIMCRVEKTEKDNVQSWKEVRERKEMSQQLSEKNEWEVNDII